MYELSRNKALIPENVIILKIMALDCLILSQVSKS